jgi:predicted 2-oxoglutarate/Fe(II)-dependent dioxygenase YbiX
MIENQDILNKEQLFPGILVYRNIIDNKIIDRVESFIDNEPHINWQEATVGYSIKMPEYRDCVDFKFNKQDNPENNKSKNELNNIWQTLYDSQIKAVNDYCQMYNIKMNYWEAMNFIKYGPGQHFMEHADHGFSYICTLSAVLYPNDNYLGGELFFPKLNLKIKPKAGDLYLFPSTYIYSHQAMPVTEGIKYSIVTMLDYNDNAHTPEYLELTEGKQSI